MKKTWEVVLYSSRDGRDSVLKEIDSFGENDSIKILKIVELLKIYGHSVLETHIKHINGKIWENKNRPVSCSLFSVRESTLYPDKGVYEDDAKNAKK